MIFALLILTLLLLLGIFVVVKKVKNGTRGQKQNLPPGPLGLPLFGHLVSLGLNPHLTLIKWKKKYGPIISCRFGSFQTVVLCDSKLIKEAYNMPEFAGRPILQGFSDAGCCKGIIFSEGRYNTELRQFTTRKLKEFGIVRKTISLEDKISQGNAEFMDFIKMRKGLPIKSEQVPSAHLVQTLWSIMVKDELNKNEVEHLTRIVQKLSTLGPVLSELAGFMPWLEKLSRTLTFGRISLTAARSNPIKEFYSFFPQFLDRKKINQVKGQGQDQAQCQMATDIMDLYLEKIDETTDESSPFHASHDSARYFLADIFGAGIHTAHITLLWMLYFMAKNPEVQKKLQEEIDQVMDGGNSGSRLPSLSDRGQMPYADAVVFEVLRMSSVAPLGVPRKITEDVRFHGYTIRKDTIVFANTYGIHYDPEIYGDPENFRPERWFGQSGQKLKNEHFLPFSTGRRICLGEALSREQLFLYITTLFQQYTVGFDKGKVPKVKGIFGVTFHPSNFTLAFKERQKLNK